jgi:hypothetical protein
MPFFQQAPEGDAQQLFHVDFLLIRNSIIDNIIKQEVMLGLDNFGDSSGFFRTWLVMFAAILARFSQGGADGH